ncbi:MAG: carboxypeptidase regulatory-like domain-containing protein [Candidatus Omnitrophica bacterium]|nr:carboxypeptidase regulatory-like domain-containing protein [Candidatus Omnitrophota bacterium]
MKTYLSILGCLSLAAFCSGIETWDACRDFAVDSNPAGPWAYGWEDADGQHFTAYNGSGKSPEGLDCWWSDHWTTVGGIIARTHSDLYLANGFRFPPRQLAMHPGPQGQRAALRWTAPSTCALWLQAQFAGLHASTTTDVHICHNGTELFAGNIRGQMGVNHQTFLKVQKNDTIDFTVGYGGDAYTCDYTGAQISLSAAGGAGVGFVSGKVRSTIGPITDCQVLVVVDDKSLRTQTDKQGHYRLALPAGSRRLQFKASQYAPLEAEVSLEDGAERDCSVCLNHSVDFSYAFACPHRMTAPGRGASDKTLLDVFPDHLRISWTYHNMTEVPLAAPPIQHADHFIEVWPSLDGKPFTGHRWTRPDSGIPILEDNYTSDEASVGFEYIGGRETMIVRVTATNNTGRPKVIVVRCLDRGKGEALRWFDPAAPGDTLMAPGRTDAPQVSLLVSGPPNHLRDQKAVSLLWRLEPGEARVGWLLRPYDLAVDSLPDWRQRDWNIDFTEAETKWAALLSKAMAIQLPDKGVQRALYAAMGDILTMQEPAANGIVTQTTGSEVYRFSNAGDCAAAVVALAQGGFLDQAMEAFQTQFFVAQPDGNWSGGAFPDFVGFSGFKAWVAMEFYHLNHDKAFLEKLYPFMLSSSRWHEKRRSQSRREENGKPMRGYGLIQPTMQDCGMIDKSGKGVFIPHNIWTVYADRITLETARRLGRHEEEAEISGIYEKAYKDLMACIESGTIDEPGYRWIPGSPNDPSGSFWGVLNLAYPCELVPFNDSLMNGTMRKMVSMIGSGGLTKHTGYQPQVLCGIKTIWA